MHTTVSPDIQIDHPEHFKPLAVIIRDISQLISDEFIDVFKYIEKLEGRQTLRRVDTIIQIIASR